MKANTKYQCLAFDSHPLRLVLLHHVGDHLPRAVAPSNCAATKRSTTGGVEQAESERILKSWVIHTWTGLTWDFEC